MNHPVTMQTLAKIHQAEMLREAEARRAARNAQADIPWRARQWLVVAFAVVTMAIVVGVLISVA